MANVLRVGLGEEQRLAGFVRGEARSKEIVLERLY
jgi:hypothetical protein